MGINQQIERIKYNIMGAYAEAEKMDAELPVEQNSEHLSATIASIQINNDPTVRPVGWLDLPEPVDDEMFLLVHIPEGGSEAVSFTVTCAGNYTVELGIVQYQLFVPASSRVIQSGMAYEAELSAADFRDALSEGTKQAVIRISGKDIKTWTPSEDQAIVEIKCRLPSGTSVKCGNSNADLALKSLKYFTWRGKNSLTSAAQMFRNCSSLVTVGGLDTSNAANMSLLFHSCTSLVSSSTLDMASAVNVQSLFSNCRNLKSVHCIGGSRINNMDSWLASCGSLTSLTFRSDIKDWPGADFTLPATALNHTALVKLFRSLPVIIQTHSINIGSSNPGRSELTEADKAIATAKNWALML